MIEREGKILNINKDEVIAKILSLWGKKVFDWIISWEYYKNKDDVKIRVRNEEERGVVVCFKKSIWEDTGNVKVREEIEFVIDSKEKQSFVTILWEIWFKEHKKIYKKRTSFELAWNRIEIDEYDNIPVLMEIEGETDEDIEAVAKLLWFNKSDLVDLSFADIEKLYKTGE
jgi:predicted adenylyl cyclase CyaB